MIFKIQVEVSNRKDVLDPEAKAILQALKSLNFPVNNLSVSKKFYLEINAKNEDVAFQKVEQACKELLANPVIQDYIIESKLDSKSNVKKPKQTNSIESKKLTSKEAKNTKIKSIDSKPKLINKTRRKRGEYKNDAFLDSISDTLKTLKYNNDIGFGMIASAIKQNFNVSISTKTLYQYFVRKLGWKKKDSVETSQSIESKN